MSNRITRIAATNKKLSVKYLELYEFYEKISKLLENGLHLRKRVFIKAITTSKLYYSFKEHFIENNNLKHSHEFI